MVLISCGGTYEFSGTSEDGQIRVNTTDKDSVVHIRLNNLNLTSLTDAPFFVINSSRTIVKSLDGTKNSFTDSKTRSKVTYTKKGGTKVKEDTTSACIYAKGDLTLNGNGTIVINANYKNGVQVSDDLRIRDTPNIKVKALNNAFKGKGSVDIEGGIISLAAEKGTGIKSDEGEDEEQIVEEKGSVYIKGGEISIVAGEDGIFAYNEIIIDDSETVPELTIQTIEKGLKATNIRMGNAISATYAQKDGWKANGDVTIYAGTHYISGNSDGIQSNGAISFEGGVTIVENQSVKGTATIIVSVENEVLLRGGTLLGFGKKAEGGNKYKIDFYPDAYYGTEKIAFKPSFEGSLIVFSDDSEIKEQDVDGWNSVCFPGKPDNCYYYEN